MCTHYTLKCLCHWFEVHNLQKDVFVVYPCRYLGYCSGRYYLFQQTLSLTESFHRGAYLFYFLVFWNSEQITYSKKREDRVFLSNFPNSHVTQYDLYLTTHVCISLSQTQHTSNKLAMIRTKVWIGNMTENIKYGGKSNSSDKVMSWTEGGRNVMSMRNVFKYSCVSLASYLPVFFYVLLLSYPITSPVSSILSLLVLILFPCHVGTFSYLSLFSMNLPFFGFFFFYIILHTSVSYFGMIDMKKVLIDRWSLGILSIIISWRNLWVLNW